MNKLLKIKLFSTCFWFVVLDFSCTVQQFLGPLNHFLQTVVASSVYLSLFVDVMIWFKRSYSFLFRLAEEDFQVCLGQNHHVILAASFHLLMF